MQFVEIPEVITISKNRLLIRKAFELVAYRKSKSESQSKNEENLKDNIPSGIVTRKIKIRMVEIIENWLSALKHSPAAQSGFKLFMPTFVTLTLPCKQFHTDKELNAKALNRFIIVLKRKYGVKQYLWRAEKQDNSNIHYHIIIDKFVSWKLIRMHWNDIMNDLGYIEIYRRNQELFHVMGFKVRTELLENWSKEKQYNAYIEGIENNWSNPNTTDIHALHKVKDVANYITKYICKHEEFRQLQKVKNQYAKGEISQAEFDYFKSENDALMQSKKVNARLWGCSDELRDLKNFKMECDSKCHEFITDVANHEKSRVVCDEHFTIVYNNNLSKIISLNPQLKKLLTQHYKNAFNHLYLPPPAPPDIVLSDITIEKIFTVTQLKIFS